MKSTISSKGQITVPAEVRDRLGLVPGTTVLFELRDDGVLLRKGTSGAHPVDRLFGVLRGTRGAAAATQVDEMRGPKAAEAASRRTAKPRRKR